MDDFDPADRLKTLNKIACITKLDVRVERADEEDNEAWLELFEMKPFHTKTSNL